MAKSQYQHGFTYDLFLSYSTRDVNWVRPFHDDLIADINRFADEDVHVFLDKARIQPGYVWDEQILAAAGESAVFVPVLSPRFFQSDYCQKEVKAFIDANGLGSGGAHRSRIMPVQLLSTAPQEHLLAKVQATAFCREGDDGIPYEHAPGSPDYRDALRKLAYAIAQVLKSVPPKRQGRAAVYLAPDFRPASEKLRASLSHHFDVLPGQPMELPGLSPEELTQALARDFARSFASIHPLSEAPFAKPLIDAQLDFAKKQNKPRLVWTPDRPDELANAGFEWFTSQAEIEERVRRLHEKPPAPPAVGADRLIYFLCPDRGNRLRAEPLLDALQQRGLLLQISPLDGPADQAMLAHASALDELDGCLIYYGDVDQAWFDGVFLRVRKKIRQRALPSIIFRAPPPSSHKEQDLRALGVGVVDRADEAARFFLDGAA